MKNLIALMTAGLVVAGNLWSQEQPKDFTRETAAERDARMGWFREARFGMFIHWGVYSVPAGEWNGKKNYGEWFMEETKMPVSQYEQFAKEFNPVKFDAKEWVKLAKNAGMKYLVITSKHHDGFGMYRSELTDWCIKGTPFQRDPMKELADACKEAGLTFCLYHSIMDWHHPDWGTRRKWNDKATGEPDMDRYTAFMKGQLKELLTGYGPIGILWFDGEWEKPWTHARGVDLYNYVRGLQPSIIVNNRVGKGRAGMSGMDQGKERIGDYGTPEQEIPPTGFGAGVDWESCMTMNNHWGYNKNDQNWKSTATLVKNLVDCASKGGNYLLNVGPTSEGLIPVPSVERLQEIGNWMKINSEAIYGTTASPFKKLAWGKCTQKSGKLYLFVFDWPQDGKLLVPMANKISAAKLLAAPGEAIKGTDSESGQTLQLPAKPDGALVPVIVVETTGPIQALATTPVIKQGGDGTLALKAADAELVGGKIKLENKSGDTANIGYWIDQKDYVQWPVMISKPGDFEVQLEYACEPGSDKSQYVLSIGGTSCEGVVKATGGWSDFRTEKAGQITLQKTGPETITLTAKTKPGLGVMNVRKVTLVPVK